MSVILTKCTLYFLPEKINIHTINWYTGGEKPSFNQDPNPMSLIIHASSACTQTSIL